MTNFTDVFKNNFLEEYSTMSLSTALTTVLLALVLSGVIYLVYWFAFNGVVYSKNFNVSLVAVCLVTCVIVVAISTNIVLSLGMVGALSIVRFRTAIKEPLDVAYMYWAITTGIVCGARLYTFAILATLLIGAVFYVLSRMRESNNKYILIINYSIEAMVEIEKVLSKTQYIVRSRNINNTDSELVAEVKVKKDNMAFLNNLKGINSVTNVSLVSYKGD